METALEIVVRPTEVFALAREIRKRDGTLAAAGVITMVTIDPATRKSRPVPDGLAAACRS